MKVALAQLNPIVGDLEGNAKKVREAFARGGEAGADLVVTSELVLTGYPPRDLLEQPSFVESSLRVLDELASAVRGPALLVGFVDRKNQPEGRRLYNAAALLRDGHVVSVHHKKLLPTYDVFDEDRYFEPGRAVQTAQAGDESLGVTICEDAWNDPGFWPERRYSEDPVAEAAEHGATVLINISASPYVFGKLTLRQRMLANHARKHRRPLVFVNQVGGNDELVFDGSSAVFDVKGRMVASCRSFVEDFQVVDLARTAEMDELELTEDVSTLHAALVLGTRDYCHKSGFADAVIGVSGGIDSALVTCLAVDALGADHVRVLSMPGPYSSQHSRGDARALAQALGVRLDVLDINEVYQGYLKTLKPVFEDRPSGTAEENIQARIRGNLLMAVSNKLGNFVLTTGNKSEMAVGYCTLYGDMAGGLAVISDVPKTKVYELARYINSRREVIPESTFTKPPSAELKPNQTDQDTLPPYDVLDAILQAYVEEHLDGEQLVARGFDRAVVQDVLRRVAGSEYKRKQAPPGLKVTSKAFGTGRRMPLVKRRPQ